MACTNCFQNCFEIVSDGCVKYTGPDIPLLGICTDDTLSIVEAQIFEHLINVMDGSGIVLTDVSLEDCPWLQAQFIGKDKTIVNLFQLLIDGQCSLKETIDSFNQGAQIFDTKCLTGLPENPTSVDILQAAVTLLCSIKTTVDSFPTEYVKISDLSSLVSQILASSSSATTVPKYCPILYTGPLSNFDNTGRGSVGEYVGWYIMNGLNGTQDWRGRTGVGAVRNVPGGTLDNAVDPSIQGSNVNYGVGDKFGEAFHKLSTSEIPSHTHPITDPGHDHPLPHGIDGGGNKYSSGWMKYDTNTTTKTTWKTTTGVLVGAAGGDQSHENRQPSAAGVWIIRL